MSIETKFNFDGVKTSELLEFYNANSEKQVAKFTNLETAQRRVQALIEKNIDDGAFCLSNSEFLARVTVDAAPAIIETPLTPTASAALVAAVETATATLTDAVQLMHDESSHEKPVVTGVDEGLSESTSAFKWPYQVTAPANSGPTTSPKVAKGQTRRSNAEGVSASWRDGDVRDRRLTREHVFVAVGNGKPEEFTSVSEAFRHFRLPHSKHVPFRLKLKASRREVFTNDGKEYTFTYA
jgi:hypothetical protein